MKEREMILLLLLASTCFALFSMLPAVRGLPNEFEMFGPRVDQILIKLYANAGAEFAALEAGEIDVASSSLTKYWSDRWSGNPEIVMADYGGERGAYQFDLNLNESRRLAGPAGARSYTYTLSIAAAIPEYRHALAHLIDRVYIVSNIMQGFAVPLYSMVPPALGIWANPAVVEMHPYNPAEAAGILDAAGVVDSDGNGFRNWPGGMMGGSDIVLDIVVRIDHSPGRKEVGDRLIWELTTNLPGAKFKVNRWSAFGSVGARKWWSDGKCADIYTGGWALTRDPDYLFTFYHSSMYHSGRPPNVGYVHDPELDGYLEGILWAENFAQAKTSAWEAQRVIAEKSLVIPIYTNSAPKAGRARYTGGTNGVPVSPDDGENTFRGKEWKGFANEYAKGLNSWWTFLNAHPDGYELSPDSAANPMTMRYGLGIPELNSLNPLYGQWAWDWEVMSKVYDSLLMPDPYEPSEDLEWIANRWQILVLSDAGSAATELVFELRSDVYFHDGVQMTADDIYFSLVELVDASIARDWRAPYLSYISNLLDISTVIIESPFRVRIRMDSVGFFALHRIGGSIILPRHIWGPIAMGPDMIIGTADDNTYDLEAFAPDPHLIGSGPFKVYPHSIGEADKDYYVPYSYLKLDAFKPASEGHFAFKTVTERATWTDKLEIRVWSQMLWLDISLDEYIAIQANDGTWFWYDTNTKEWIRGNRPEIIGGEPNKPPGANPWKTTVPHGRMEERHYKPEYSMLRVEPPQVGATAVWLVGKANDFPWKIREGGAAPEPMSYIQGDINDDSVVDIEDLTLLSVQFEFKAWIWAEIDVNMDNSIDLADAGIIIRDWTG